MVAVCDSVVVVRGVCEGLKEIGFVFEFISYLLLQDIISLQETTEDGVVVGNMDQQWRVRALQTQQLCLKLHTENTILCNHLNSNALSMNGI